VQQLKDYIHISPFWEENLSDVSELIGEDRVLFGSDFPHPEGLAEPRSYMEALTGASPERVAKIMGGNLARLMNVDVSVPA
jgi:predicted TIM-barrel fold metal-dependent hydrolase